MGIELEGVGHRNLRKVSRFTGIRCHRRGRATNEITTLRGTVTVGSKVELGTAATLEAIEKVAMPAMVVATAGDIMAHGTCAMAADPALANAALQSIP